MAADRAELEALFHRYQPAVTAYCLACARGQRATALDWTQDIFITVFEHLPQLQDPSKVEGWLFTIARHHCLRQTRESQARSRAAAALALLMRQEDETVELAEREAVLSQLEAACASIESASHREMVQAHYAHGEKTRDIAARLGVPHGTVTVTLMRFRNKLKAQLLLALAEGDGP